MPMIEVTDLRKVYGQRTVVDGVSFSVESGEIFGILGPNGAGKTTAVECIGGLRQRDGGTITVAGMDPAKEGAALREVLGIQLQESRLPDKMSVAEALDLYASFYPEPHDPAELLDRLGLVEQRTTYFAKLSGGQKQRLSVALALIGNPKVAILDELTTGLDPVAVARSGICWRTSAPPASPCCWSPTSWKRLSGCVTGSSSSTMAGSSPLTHQRAWPPACTPTSG